jgi:hypothetical protein
MKHPAMLSLLLLLLLLGVVSALRLAAAEPARNVAPLATVTASVKPDNAPRAVDGKVPAAGSRDDAGQTWVVGKADLPASLLFTWEKPQPIRTLVYYGRTTWGFECFKDYEVYLDAATTPAAGCAGLYAGAAPQDGRVYGCHRPGIRH